MVPARPTWPVRPSGWLRATWWPSGTLHNFRNTGVNPLVLYTVYGPAEHAAGAVYATKEEADAAEEFGQDEPPVD